MAPSSGFAPALAKAPAADPLAEAQALLDSGEWARAESLAAGVAAQTRDFLIAGRAETIEAQSLVDQGQMANAEPHARRALQFLTGASTPENLLVLDQARSTLAQVMTWAGKLDEALEFGQMVLARERSAQGVSEAQPSRRCRRRQARPLFSRGAPRKLGPMLWSAPSSRSLTSPPAIRIEPMRSTMSSSPRFTLSGSMRRRLGSQS